MIYESSVENMKLCDLRKDDNVKVILNGFREILVQKWNPNLEHNMKSVLRELVGYIDSGNIGSGNLKKVAQRTGGWFTDYLKSLGYEGLITFEGGESGGNGDHDTFVIFDPEKIKINEEHNIGI